MILNNVSIIEAVKTGAIYVDDFDVQNVGPNSIDVHLGDTFYILEWLENGPRYFGPIKVKEGQGINIPLGYTILGHTREVIGSNKFVCRMQARSTTARMGVMICRDAGLGDVGYINHWTMEISSTSKGVFLMPGMRIGQITFEEIMLSGWFYAGQYTGKFPECMVPSKYRASIAPPSDGQMCLLIKNCGQ